MKVDILYILQAFASNKRVFISMGLATEEKYGIPLDTPVQATWLSGVRPYYHLLDTEFGP